MQDRRLNNIEMEIKEAIEVLKKHNKWRCDNSVPSIYEADNPKKITEAINIAVTELKNDSSPNVSYHVAQQYAEFCVRCDS